MATTVTPEVLTTAAKLRDEGATWNAIREATGLKLGSSGWFRAWEKANIKHRPANEMKPRTNGSAPAAGLTREQLEKVFMDVLHNWAATTADIVKGTDLDAKVVTKAAKKLEGSGLLAGTHVNGAKELTWQTYFDIQNEADALANGTAAFNEKFPVTIQTKTKAKTTRKPAAKVKVTKTEPTPVKDVPAATKAKVNANLAAAKSPKRTRRTQPTENRISAGVE